MGLIVIDHEYHIVELHDLAPVEMFDWLENNLGDGKDGRWFWRFPRVYFFNKKDHLMFLLRWGGYNGNNS